MTSRPPTDREFKVTPESVNVNGVCPMCGFAARSAVRHRELCVDTSKTALCVHHEDPQLSYCFAVETQAA